MNRTRKLLFFIILACSLVYLTLFTKTLTLKSLEVVSYANLNKRFFSSDVSLSPSTYAPANKAQDQSVCRLPELKMIGHENVERYVPCKMIHEWGYLKNGHWHLNKTALDILGIHAPNEPQCKYRNVTRPVDDFHLAYSNYSELLDGQVIGSEVIEVECAAPRSRLAANFSNIYVQIVDKLDEIIKKKREKKTSSSSLGGEETCQPLNILLLSYDSMSRVSWFKRLPLTTEYTLNKSGFVLLQGFNIVGDGTPACMIPLLTGATESELPSTLKSNPEGHFVDQVYPFIWQDLHEKGYISFHMEDWPQVSAFTYRLRGMSNRTVDHYMRAYQFGLWQRVSKAYFGGKDDLCVGAQKRHKRALDLIHEFVRMYEGRGRPYVAITHYIENSHDGNARAKYIDADLKRFLERALAATPGSGFNNTIIFLYSDHGARFATERLTPQGELEERLPFFAIRLPDSYKRAHPDKYENLVKNARLLTTPFDIYATLRDVSCLGDNNRTRLVRSQSLLRPISPKRSCRDIGLSMHYCVCELDWRTDNKSTPMSELAIKFTIDYMNELIAPASPRFCMTLSLMELSAVKYADTFFDGVNKTYFKLEFATSPNKGKYSAVVKYDPATASFSIDSPASISRTNAYGTQSKCLERMKSAKAELRVDLRKFCYCKPPARPPNRFQNRFDRF